MAFRRLLFTALSTPLLLLGVQYLGEGTALATTHTLTIPLVTIQVGQRTFGPFSIGNNTQAVLSIDRTVAGGLNSLPATDTLDVLIQSSPDNGVTWTNEVETTFAGGPQSNHHGVINTDILTVNGLDVGRNSCRVIATVAGADPIAVAGNVVVS